jgi:hypothetical protein
MKNKPVPGTVIQIALPTGKFAYGRLYKDASIGVYKEISSTPGQPPIGSRAFQFNVGAYDDVFTSTKSSIVGNDPFTRGEDPWPPPRCIVDSISGQYSIYHRGEIKSAFPEECQGMEIAAVWELEHIIDRILRGNESVHLKDASVPRETAKTKIQ